jgi:hypothetical protein
MLMKQKIIWNKEYFTKHNWLIQSNLKTKVCCWAPTVHFDCTKNTKTDNWVLVAFFFVFELLLWSSICSATKDIAEVAASDVTVS